MSLAYLLLAYLGQIKSKLFNVYKEDILILSAVYDFINSAIMTLIRYIQVKSDSYKSYATLIPNTALRTFILDFKLVLI